MRYVMILIPISLSRRLIQHEQARVPERLRPGKFDIWGSSHQIFHVLIILAAMAHLIGLLKAFDYAKRFSKC